MPAKPTIPRVCDTCGNGFHVHPYVIKNGHGNFCSRSCNAQAIRPRPALSPARISADGSVLIPLLDRNGSIRDYAIIDAADGPLVNQWRWHFDHGYASRSTGGRRQRIKIYLHRLLLGLSPGDGMNGDHIDGVRLNNRRTNLRTLPKGGNQQNVPSRSGSSKYRGVSWHTANRKWRASVRVKGKTIFLGYFVDEDAAGAAARNARTRLMPYSARD